MADLLVATIDAKLRVAREEVALLEAVRSHLVGAAAPTVEATAPAPSPAFACSWLPPLQRCQPRAVPLEEPAAELLPVEVYAPPTVAIRPVPLVVDSHCPGCGEPDPGCVCHAPPAEPEPIRQLRKGTHRAQLLDLVAVATKPLSYAEVARALGIERWNVPTLVASAHREGLLRTNPDPCDGRRTLILPGSPSAVPAPDAASEPVAPVPPDPPQPPVEVSITRREPEPPRMLRPAPPAPTTPIAVAPRPVVKAVAVAPVVEQRRTIKVEGITCRDDRFRCEECKCVLNAGVCIERQQKAGADTKGTNGAARTARDAAIRYFICRDCPQGREVAARVAANAKEAAE